MYIYDPVTLTYKEIPQPIDDAAALNLLSGRKGGQEVYNYIRFAYPHDPVTAWWMTCEHFQCEDRGDLSPISTEVEGLY